MSKTYVTFFYETCGGYGKPVWALCGGGTAVEVADRDISNLDIPKGACGFRFFDSLQGPRNYSPIYRIVRKLLTAEEVQKEISNPAHLLEYMELMNSKFLVMNMVGGFECLPPGDGIIVIDEKRNVLYPRPAAPQASAENDISRLCAQKPAKPVRWEF